VTALPENVRLPREVVQLAWEQYPARTALITAHQTLSYAQLRDRVLVLATNFSRMGLSSGDVCYAQLGTETEGLLASLAASRCGIILIGVPQQAGPEVLGYFCQYVTPAGFLYEAAGEADAAVLRQMLPGIVCCRHDLLDLNSEPPNSARALPAQSPDDIGMIGFSSGTTGVPKVMQASYGIHLTGVRLILRHVLPAQRRSTQLVMLVCIPVFGAGSGVLLPTWFSGGTLVIPPRYAADDILRLIPLHKATHIFITPSLLIDLLDYPQLGQTDLSSLCNITYGTELMPAAKLEEAIRRFGPILQQGYGSAEVLPPVTLLQPEEHLRDGQIAPRSVLNSVGKPVPEVQVIIANDEDEALPVNAIGHVLIKSPTQFKGYLNRPDLSDKVQRGGWLHIGDIGYLDQDGMLHVLGRAPDLIRRMGNITYPRYAEEALHDHPAVKETAFVQVGEQAIMAVSLRQAWRTQLGQSALADEMLSFLAQRVGAPDLPDHIRLLEELPRSPLGKVLRREVRQRLESEAAATPAG